MRTLGLLLPKTIVLLLCGAAAAAAQPPGRRVEVGVQASFLRLGEFDTTNAGIGGRASFDLTRWAALDAEGNSSRATTCSCPQRAWRLRCASRTTAGAPTHSSASGSECVRAGLASSRESAPASPASPRRAARPECVGPQCALVLLVRPEYGTEFALDLGGGLEFHPSARTVARFDLGDTMIRHRGLAPPCWGTDCTRHYLSSRLGVGVRF